MDVTAGQLRLARIGSAEHGPRWNAAGELDIEAALAVASLADAGEDVELALERVTFIDSSGLRALLTLRHELVAAGHGLTLVNPSDAVEHVLDVTATRSVFHIVTSTETRRTD